LSSESNKTPAILAQRFSTDAEQKAALEKAMHDLLYALGADLESAGVKETPQRAAKYWLELTEGMRYTNHDIAEKFNKCFDAPSNAMVVERDITVFSHCEHHTALIYNAKVAVAYIPADKVIGLSKIARICEMCAKRLQLQERIVQDIYEVLQEVLGTDDIYIRMEASHGCMTARGVKSYDSTTVCQGIHGKFITEPDLRQEAIALMERK